MLFQSMNQQPIQSSVGSSAMQTPLQSALNRHVQIQQGNLPPQTILSQASNLPARTVALSGSRSITELLAQSQAVALSQSVPLVSQSGSISVALSAAQPQTIDLCGSVSVAQMAVQPQNVLQSSILSSMPSAAQSQTVTHFGSVSNSNASNSNVSVAQFISEPQTIIQSGSTSFAQSQTVAQSAQSQTIIQSASTPSATLAEHSTIPNSPRRVASVVALEQQYKLARLKRALLQHQLLQSQRAAAGQGATNQPRVVTIPQGSQPIDPNLLCRLGQLGKGMTVSHLASVPVPAGTYPASDFELGQQTAVSMPQGAQLVDPNLVSQIGDVGTGMTVSDNVSVAPPTAPFSDLDPNYTGGVPLQKSVQSIDSNFLNQPGITVENSASTSVLTETVSTSEPTSVSMGQSVQLNLVNQLGNSGKGSTIKHIARAPVPASSIAADTADLNPNVKYIAISLEEAGRIPGVTADMLADIRLQGQQGSKSPRVLIPLDRLKEIMGQRPETRIMHVDLTAKTPQVPQSSPSRNVQINLTSPRAQAVPLGRGTPKKTAFAKYNPKPKTGALVQTVSVLQKPKISVEMKTTLPPTSQATGIVTFSSTTTGGIKSSPLQASVVSAVTTPQVLPAAIAQSPATVATSQRNRSQSVPMVMRAPATVAQAPAAPQLVLTDVACNPSDRFIQWRNEDALCWLDVVLSLLVFNKSIRSPTVMNKLDSTNVIRTICAAYDQALNIIRSSSWEEGSPVKSSGQVGCIKGMVGTGGGGTEVSTPSSLSSTEGGVLMEKFFDSIDTDKSKCDQTKSLLVDSSAPDKVGNLVEIPSESASQTSSLPAVSKKSGIPETIGDSRPSAASLVLREKDLPASSINQDSVDQKNSNKTDDTDNVVQMRTDEEWTGSVSESDDKLTPVVICDSDEIEASVEADSGEVRSDQCGQVCGSDALQTSAQSDTKLTGSPLPDKMNIDESSKVVEQLEKVCLAGEVTGENIPVNIDTIDSVQSETVLSASDTNPQPTSESASQSAQIVTPSEQSNESTVADQNVSSNAPSTLSQTASDKLAQSGPTPCTPTGENSNNEGTDAAPVPSVSQSVSASAVTHSQTETKPAKKPSARFFVPVMASSDPNQPVRHIKFSRPLSADMKKILALPPEDRQAMVKDLTKEDKDELIHYYIQYLFPGLEIEQYFEARDIINGARDEMWTYLEPRLKCEKGKNDSPMIALYMVLSSVKALKANFLVNATWILQCQICFKKKIERQSKTLITFPNVGPDWTMQDAYFIRSCYFCGAPKQKRNMVVKDFPPSVALHFMEGLPTADLESYDFVKDKYTYRVTGCIQYRKFPDHFITWLRDPDTNSWMECDDLKLPVCQYTKNKPSMQPSEVHIVVWERQEVGETDEMQADIADPEAEISMDSTASSNVSTSKISMVSSTSPVLSAATSCAVTSTPCFALAPPPPTSMVANLQAAMRTPEKVKTLQVVPTSPDVAIIGVSPSPDVAITHTASPSDLVITHIDPPKQGTATKRGMGPRAGIRRKSADSSQSAPTAKVPRLANTPAVAPTTQQTFGPIQSTSSSISTLSESVLSDIRDAMLTLNTQQNREFSEMLRQVQEIVNKYKLCQQRVEISGESQTTVTLKSQLQKAVLNIITRMPPSVGKGFFNFYQQNGLISEKLVLTIKQTNQPRGTPGTPTAGQVVTQTPGGISPPASAASGGIRPVMMPCRPASTTSLGQSTVLRGQLAGAAPKAEKSYLKLVHPLLEKALPGLAQKGTQKVQYAGYVPLSQRNPDPAPVTVVSAVASPALSTMTAATARPQTATHQQPIAAPARPQAPSTYQQLTPTTAKIVRMGIQQRFANSPQNVRQPIQRMITAGGQVVVLKDGQGMKIIQQQGQSILRPSAAPKGRGKSVPSTRIVSRVVATPSTNISTKTIGASDEITVADLLRARNPVVVTLSSPPPSSNQATSLLAIHALRTSLHDSSSGDAATAQIKPVPQPSTKTVQSLTSVMTPLEASVAETLQKMAFSTTGDASAVFRAAASSVVSEAQSSPPSSADVGNVVPDNVVRSVPVDAIAAPPDVVQEQPQMEITATSYTQAASDTVVPTSLEPVFLSCVPVSSATVSNTPTASHTFVAANTPVPVSDSIATPTAPPVQPVQTKEVLTTSPEPVPFVSKIIHEPTSMPVVSKMLHVPAGLPALSADPPTPQTPAPSAQAEPVPSRPESTPMLASTADWATVSKESVPSCAAPIARTISTPAPATRKKAPAPSPVPKVVTPVAKVPLPVATPTESLGLGKRVRRKPVRFLDDDESDSSSMSGKSPSRSSTGSSPKRARGNSRKQSVERSVSAAVLEVRSTGESFTGIARGRGRTRGSVERSVSTPLLDVPILLGDDAAVHQRRGRGRASGRGRGKANSPVAINIDSLHAASALLAQGSTPVRPSAVRSSQPSIFQTVQAASQLTETGRPRRQVRPTRKSLECVTPQQLESLTQLQARSGPGEVMINMDNVRMAADGSLIIVQAVEGEGATSADMAGDSTAFVRGRSDSNDSSQDVTVISESGDVK